MFSVEQKSLLDKTKRNENEILIDKGAQVSLLKVLMKTKIYYSM